MAWCAMRRDLGRCMSMVLVDHAGPNSAEDLLFASLLAGKMPVFFGNQHDKT